jgi:hypothetical protein
MNVRLIKHILKCLGAKHTIISGSWLNFSCLYAPFNHKGSDTHPSAGVSILEPYIYNCFSCGVKKKLQDVCYELKNLYVVNSEINEAIELVESLDQSLISFEYETDYNEKGTRTIWPETYLDKYPKAYRRENKKIHPYLIKRQLNFEISEKLDFRLDKRFNRLCIPIYSHEHSLIGFHGRQYCETSLPSWFAYSYNGIYNKNLWLGEHWVNYNKPVIIAESVFDLAKVLYVYNNVISPLSASFGKEKCDIIKPAYEIITAFDNDSAGDKARINIEKWMYGRRIKHAIPYTDFGDMDKEQIGEILDRYI